ncbi:unnamed protein product [Chrysodeixis includens]|uniref:Uncharacterized protein n=1 Tax=Chrysodeixis includens TaxID=689277 RepID=A0A9P0C0T4_CHRIL|nr:unnamed protein product [Chrysodeixis includens]
MQGGAGGGSRGVYVLPHPVLLACPSGSPMCPALQAHSYYARGAGADGGGARALADAATAVRSYASPDDRDRCAGDAARVPSRQLQKENKTWRIFRDIGTDKLCDNEPDRVEVYYFEHGTSEFLATCEGGRPTAVERVAGRGARLAGALLAELLAAPQLLLAAPVALLLHVQRCGLVALRGAATGLLQTTSDYALKPALALTFNALLQPLLVFVGNVGRGVREALRPLAAALGDVLEPAARLLASARLVDVRLACPLHAAHAHHAQV